MTAQIDRTSVLRAVSASDQDLDPDVLRESWLWFARAHRVFNGGTETGVVI